MYTLTLCECVNWIINIVITKILRTLKNVANYPTLYQQLYVADTYTLIINLVYSLQADLQCRHYDFMTLCQRSCHWLQRTWCIVHEMCPTLRYGIGKQSPKLDMWKGYHLPKMVQWNPANMDSKGECHHIRGAASQQASFSFSARVT